MHKFVSLLIATAFPLSLLSISTPAAAAPVGGEAADHLVIRPIMEARARYEKVEQTAAKAEALTIRARAGAEATLGRFSVLAEGEGTIAPIDTYNAFPFQLVGEDQWRPRHAVIADPENAEINRLQLQYKLPEGGVTVGRQRINLDDQRWVGSVGWRQNEQTFDAVRAEARIGPIAADLAYAISQQTVFGVDAGPRTSHDGEFLFGGLSSKPGPLQGKLFAYLLDYDDPYFLANSSQTYGGILSGSFPLSHRSKVALRASYARQSDFGDNPFDYAASYWAFEGSANLAGFNVTAGREQLGSNNGRAVQTPAATLHRFNGWADMFLTTPPFGLEDAYVSIGRKFDGVKLVPGLNADLTFHRFGSAAAGIDYGREWDASMGFTTAGLNWLLKFADYQAEDFGADTRKLWLQTEWSL